MTTYLYLFPAYRAVEKIIYDEFVMDIENYPKTLLKILIGSFFGIFIFGTTLWLKIWEKLDRERIDWRKMVRQIPLGIFFTNKMLRNYIYHTTGIRIEPASYDDSWL